MGVGFPEITVGEPACWEGLAVFPLFAETGVHLEYQLSDEAIAEGTVSVEEISEAGSVPDLLVENRGNTRVLFLEGEELVGAKQNRILNTTVLVAAGRKTRIPVSCVEAGRWGYRSHKFGSGGTHSPLKLRGILKRSVTASLRATGGHTSDQQGIWGEVRRLQGTLGVFSSTAAMSDTFSACCKRLDEFREQVKYVEGARGMAVVLGGEVVSCDLFDKPSTCQKVWDRLLTGYVLDALEPKETQARATSEDVVRLLGGLTKLEWERADPVGEGEEWRAESDTGDHGSALTCEETLVHGSVLFGSQTTLK